MTEKTIDDLVEIVKSGSEKSIADVKIPAATPEIARDIYKGLMQYFADGGVGRVSHIFRDGVSDLAELARDPLRAQTDWGSPDCYFTAQMGDKEGGVIVQESRRGSYVQMRIEGRGFSGPALCSVVDYLRRTTQEFTLEIMSKAGDVASTHERR